MTSLSSEVPWPDRAAVLCVHLLAAVLAIAATGCVSTPGTAHKNITRNLQPDADWTTLTYCGGWGCADPQPVAFEPETVAEIRALLEAADTPDTERAAIRQAIAIMERAAGAQTGYHRDRGGTLLGAFQAGQIDCYSEATNTSNFLRVLANQQLLRFHDVAAPVMRGLEPATSFAGTHATAVIKDTGTNTEYVVDSWFHDNGVPPEIVTLDVWMKDWEPEGAPVA